MHTTIVCLQVDFGKCEMFKFVSTMNYAGMFIIICWQIYGDITYVLNPVTLSAGQYFDINDNGQITLIRDLYNSGTDMYNVRNFPILLLLLNLH